MFHSVVVNFGFNCKQNTRVVPENRNLFRFHSKCDRPSGGVKFEIVETVMKSFLETQI